ncbi:hypothetical protein HDU67_008250, partial [Dinochytrium kinnereticum]
CLSIIPVAVEKVKVLSDDDDCSEEDSCIDSDGEEDEDEDDDDDNGIDLAAASAEGWIRTLPNKRLRLGWIPKPSLFHFSEWIRCPREKPVIYKKGPIPKAMEDVKVPVFSRSYADVVAGRWL